MDRRKDKIKSELKKADDFFEAAELLHRRNLYTPAVWSAFYAALHASIAAFLTSASPHPKRDSYKGFLANFQKYDRKLDNSLDKHKFREGGWLLDPLMEYNEQEALLRIFQAREFLNEVKDFLRAAVRN